MNEQEKVRLDKWLWAARFFKTRSLAKQAIEGGKVHYNGDRCKVSKEVMIGAQLKIRQGFDEKSVIVIALSDQRRGAPEAQKLYQETEQSITQREAHAAERKAIGGHWLNPSHRPNKRDRRQLQHIKKFNDPGEL